MARDETLLAAGPHAPELSTVLMCLNEAESLAGHIRRAREGALKARTEKYGIIVADNGSADSSREIAQTMGAVAVRVPTRSYGAALRGGIKAARGKYVIMGDSDASNDFANLIPFGEKLRSGTQLVLGTSLRGATERGAMPFLHRYLRVPVLTFLGTCSSVSGRVTTIAACAVSIER